MNVQELKDSGAPFRKLRPEPSKRADKRRRRRINAAPAVSVSLRILRIGASVIIGRSALSARTCSPGAKRAGRLSIKRTSALRTKHHRWLPLQVSHDPYCDDLHDPKSQPKYNYYQNRREKQAFFSSILTFLHFLPFQVRLCKIIVQNRRWRVEKNGPFSRRGVINVF